MGFEQFAEAGNTAGSSNALSLEYAQETGPKKEKPEIIILNGDQQFTEQSLSPAMQKTADAAEAFSKEPDKAKALKEQGPNFADAVKMADTAFTTALTNARAEFEKIKPQAEQAGKDIEAAGGKVREEFDKLPDADKQKAAALVQEAQQDPSKGADVMKRMKEQFPELGAAFEGVDAEIKKHEPTLLKLAEIEAAPQAALEDCAATRSIYMEAAAAGGDNQKAQQLQVEVLKLMFGATPDQLNDAPAAPKK